MIKIHNFPRGARGVRLFWQCEEMGLPYEVVKVTFPPSESYMALNPFGTVPFLEDEDGVAINESIAIMLYLAERYGPTPLFPKDNPATMARVLHIMVLSEATLGSALNTMMAVHFAAPEADKRNWSVRGAGERVEQTLAFLNDRLDTFPHIAGKDFTLADMCVATALGMWKGALGKPIPDKLAAYRDRLVKRPAYQKAQAQAQT